MPFLCPMKFFSDSARSNTQNSLTKLLKLRRSQANSYARVS